ncbi:MAG: hypothetical protein M0R38_07940 [Bacteroidia bacterium]|nr:hypothetical protein [Bacteroidia bacterium]
MKVKVDCGSTKCDFLFIETRKILSCPGFNPNISDNHVLENNINSNQELKVMLQQSSEIVFYGTGCAKNANKERVLKVLSSLVPNAAIVVKHDLDLTLDALAGNTPCYVNILGTGSNSLFYDGKHPIQIVPSLGYILGDEGSGTWFGKQILKDFFYKKLPLEIEKAINENEQLKIEQVIERIYRSEGANRFIASFARYLSDFRSTEYVQALLHKGFQSFLDAFIFSSQPVDCPLHFSGSIAFHFADELKSVLLENNLIAGKIVKSPLEALID